MVLSSLAEKDYIGSKACVGDYLSYSSFDLTDVRLIKFSQITFFLDWCLDYAPMKCEMWKADGQCQLSDRRVQGMIRKLCMETCNYCGELLPSFSLIYQVWIYLILISNYCFVIYFSRISFVSI